MSINTLSENRMQCFALVLFCYLMLSLSPAYACELPAKGFCVDFYKGQNLEGSPLSTRKTPYIKYNWKKLGPVNHVPSDNFSARWQGRFQFAEAQYEFRALADDGVRIKVDGQTVLDAWQGNSTSEHRAQLAMTAGKHVVEVEYFEATGLARVEVDWTKLAVKVDNPSTNTNVTKTNQPKVFRNTSRPPLGINLSTFDHWSSTVPFKDLLTQSSGLSVLKQDSNAACAEQPALDQDGYPQSLPNGCFIRIWSVYHILGDDFWPAGTQPYPSGHYVLLYQGRGKIKLGWDAKNIVYKSDGRIEFDVPTPKDGIQIEVNAMEWGDHIRDMHIVNSNDEASFKEQPFNEKWLALLKPFEIIRFVDWGAVNQSNSAYYGQGTYHTPLSIKLPDSAPAEDGAFDKMVALINIDNKWPRILIDRYEGATRTLHLKTPLETATSGTPLTANIFDFTNKTWATRAPATTLGQTSMKGLAFESMIKLANTLDANPWINIPTAADDKFVEELAMLIKKSLKSTLKCYIEYSNETWNFGFPGYNYAEAKARELQLGGATLQADAWHAYRAVEVFRIFNRVFGEADLRDSSQQSRLVRVLTSQTAWFDRAKSVMDWKMPNNAWPTQGNPAYKYADAWAATTYFYLDKENSLESLGTDELITEQENNIKVLFGDSKNPGLIRKILAEAKARGLQLVAYEGGTHLTAPQNNDELVAKVAKVNKDPKMKEVYASLLNQWTSLYKEFGAGAVGGLNLYSDISRYGKYGYWGLLQSTYQDPKTAPKYQAVMDYATQP